jgi:hypothetical protein
MNGPTNSAAGHSQSAAWYKMGAAVFVFVLALLFFVLASSRMRHRLYDEVPRGGSVRSQPNQVIAH